MRALDPATLAVRTGVWIAVSMWSLHLVREPTPSLGELAAGLPLMILLTCIPGGLLLLLVRTWPGTVAASIGFAAAWLGGILSIEAESERSSTAGAGLLGLPVLAALPVLVVFVVEQAMVPRRQPSLPPPPPDPPRP